MSRWYRAYEGTVTDAKLAEVALSADVSRSVAIACWHAILENAATVNDGGRIDIPPRRAAAILCEAPQLIEKVFAEFRTIGLLDDTGVAAWKRRQFESDTSTERSRKHRETKRNADATLQNGDASPPETETEIEEDNKAIALSSDPVSEMVEIYHEAMAPAGCPRVLKLTPSRKASALQRLKDCGGMEGWRHAMAKARASPFLTGASANGWKADFDFFMQAKSFTKLLEGSYDARKPSGSVTQPKPLTGSSALLAAARSRLGPIPDGGGGEAGISRGLDAQRDGSGVYRLADRGH